MNGVEAYDNKFKIKAENIIKANADKPYLKGFYNYMNKLSNSTSYDYLMMAANFMNYINKDVKDIELDDYSEYLSRFDSDTQSYKILMYSALKKYSKYLYASKKNPDNPMQYIERPKFYESNATKEKREKGYLESNEIKKYIASVKKGVGSDRSKAYQLKWKSRDLAIVTLLLTTGIRCSGLYKLNISDLDIENKIITATEKGDKVRVYNLNEDVIDVLKEWINDRFIILDGKTEDALFVSCQRTRLNQPGIYNIIKKYNTINNKNITPHKLRATYGTQLYKKTNDIYFVQECMGHNNPKTTELYIRGQRNENTKRAADIMGNYIF